MTQAPGSVPREVPVFPGPDCNDWERENNRHDPAEHGADYRPELEPRSS